MSLEYNLLMDIALYEAQIEAFDKAVQSKAFSELPEDQKQSRLRSRAWVADYLAEAKSDLTDLQARK